MSRGFVKEDDQEEAPFVPPRAPLPDGVPNYVTPRGMRALLEERTELERARAAVKGRDDDRRREQAAIDGRLALLNERIALARPVEPGVGTPDEVRFGTTVTVHYRSGPLKGSERAFTIVGVDEAHAASARIAFTSPIARALIGRRVNDRIQAMLGPALQELEVRAITWAQ